MPLPPDPWSHLVRLSVTRRAEETFELKPDAKRGRRSQSGWGSARSASCAWPGGSRPRAAATGDSRPNWAHGGPALRGDPGAGDDAHRRDGNPAVSGACAILRGGLRDRDARGRDRRGASRGARSGVGDGGGAGAGAAGLSTRRGCRRGRAGLRRARRRADDRRGRETAGAVEAPSGQRPDTAKKD